MQTTILLQLLGFLGDFNMTSSEDGLVLNNRLLINDRREDRFYISHNKYEYFVDKIL